jgi:hypothetical protein
MRNKLARTVERIDQRRHDVLDVKKQVVRHLKEIAVFAGLVVVATGAASAYVMHRLLTAGHRRGRGGWLGPALQRLGDRGRRSGGGRGREEWVVRPEGRRRSFARDVVRSLALTLITSLLARPLKRAVRGTR